MSQNSKFNIDESDDNRDIDPTWAGLKFSRSEVKDTSQFKELDGPELLDSVLGAEDSEFMPWEEVTLPSQGKYYVDNDDNPMMGKGVVEVRPMGLAAEKILATQRLAQSGKSLDYLFKKCVKFPNNFDPVNLLAGDRTFLLYYIRGITHGNDYEFTVTCTNDACRKTSIKEYDLNSLAGSIKTYNPELGNEPFKVVLPYLTERVGKPFWVEVRLMRGYDMLDILQAHKKSSPHRKEIDSRLTADDLPQDQLDRTIERNIDMLIHSVMGNTDRHKITQFIKSDKMHSSDTATIREFINDNSPGIDTSVTVTCDHCGNEMKMELPITEGFFRPSRA